MTYTRPDLCFARTNSLQQPTYLHLKKMMHTLGHLQGTKRLLIQPTSNNSVEQQRHSNTGCLRQCRKGRMRDNEKVNSRQGQEALRIRFFLMEAIFTNKLQLRMNTDSTGDKHIVKRIGSSKKAKHIDLKYLFLQQLVHNGIQSVHKINPSDIFTEYVTAEILNKRLHKVGPLSPRNNQHSDGTHKELNKRVYWLCEKRRGYLVYFKVVSSCCTSGDSIPAEWKCQIQLCVCVVFCLGTTMGMSN